MKANLAVASVFSSTDVSHHGRMKQDGWVQPYRPKNLSELIDTFKGFNDPDGLYVATAAGLVLITYNTTLVQPKDPPKKWPDLPDPKWKNHPSLSPPGLTAHVRTWGAPMRTLYTCDRF